MYGLYDHHCLAEKIEKRKLGSIFTRCCAAVQCLQGGCCSNLHIINLTAWQSAVSAVSAVPAASSPRQPVAEILQVVITWCTTAPAAVAAVTRHKTLNYILDTILQSRHGKKIIIQILKVLNRYSVLFTNRNIL